MARKSLIVKEQQKQVLVARYRDVRDKLRQQMKDASLSTKEKLKIQFKLQKLPAKSSPSRLRMRCFVTGRARAVLTKFGLGRNEFRRWASQGLIPGIKKSSW